MPSPWRLAASLIALRALVDGLAPKRDKSSDGSIGDPSHASRASDHNPDAGGVVCAIDVTHDPERCNGEGLADALRHGCDPRIKYVIYNRAMFSSYPKGSVPAWTWRPYSGSNPHTKHVHISVLATKADDVSAWRLGGKFAT